MKFCTFFVLGCLCGKTRFVGRAVSSFRAASATWVSGIPRATPPNTYPGSLWTRRPPPALPPNPWSRSSPAPPRISRSSPRRTSTTTTAATTAKSPAPVVAGAAKTALRACRSTGTRPPSPTLTRSHLCRGWTVAGTWARPVAASAVAVANPSPSSKTPVTWTAGKSRNCNQGSITRRKSRGPWRHQWFKTADLHSVYLWVTQIFGCFPFSTTGCLSSTFGCFFFFFFPKIVNISPKKRKGNEEMKRPDENF